MPKYSILRALIVANSTDSMEEAILAPLAQTALLRLSQLSPEMSHSTGERVPGDTLRQLIEEHDQIQEFKRFVQERVDLERDHLANMEKHQRTLNPKIKESSLWSLISPLMEYFETEIQHRRDAYNSLVGHLNTILEPDHPNRDIQDGVGPLDLYKRLPEVNAVHSRYYEISRSPESISSLVEWYQRGRSKKSRLYELTDEELMEYEIPKIDLDYRHSVLEQNHVATEMRQWHDEQFTTYLEVHQQQVEDINIALRQIIETHNNLCLALVKSCSATLLAISGFSSVRFIDAAHKGQHEESLHPCLTCVTYFNFALGGRSSIGFYGTDKALDCLCERSGSFNVWNGSTPNIPRLIEEEGILFKNPSEMNVDFWHIMDLIVFSFLSMPPIFPLTDEDIKRFAKGIPRNKMNSFMRRFPISQRTKLWRQLKQITDLRNALLKALLLTHRASAGRIVADIWAMWDFDRNDTLPPNTIRIGPEHNHFQNTRTGEAYIKN